MPAKKTNVIILGIDSLRADHMSCYGYHRQTTPHIDRFATDAVLFEKNYSAHIPTTSAYASMLTGLDCFGTSVVALRHRGGLPRKIRTLPEILRSNGYNTSCVGFSGNPSSRGFNRYLDYPSWGSFAEGRSPKAENLNQVAIPELERLSRSKKPFFLFLRHMDPHAPYLPPAPFERMFYSGNEFDPKNKSMEPVFSFKPFCDFFADWMPPGVRDRHYVDAQYDGAVAYMDACIQRILTRVEELGLGDNTLIVINGDHGETLYEHECWYDHHGMYENTLHVTADHSPARQAARRPARRRHRTAPRLGAHRAQAPQHPHRHRIRRPVAAAADRGPESLQLLGLLHHGMHLDAQARLAHPGVEADGRARAGFPLQARSRAV